MLENFVDVPLGDGSAEILVITWHHHLHQILVGHPLILVGVEITDNIVSVGFSCLFDSIISAYNKRSD